jgi:PKD repeat protein
VHAYAVDGTYTVTLTLTDVWGAAASITRVVTIAKPATNLPPIPVINPVVCAARACTIYGVSSSDPNSDPFTYLWNFGDGTATSTTTNPAHTFAANTSYTVTLTVTDAWGDAATTTRVISFAEPATNAAPVPVIGVPVCTARTCVFSSFGTVDPDGDPFTYSWNFGDGSAVNTTANPSRTYAADNAYSVTLTVTDGWGKSAVATRVVTIAEPATNVAPVPVINAPSCAGRVCAFSGNGSADANGDAFTYSWNWGDATAVSTGQNPAPHTFAVAGTYTVTLTVTDAWGKFASITRSVTVT